MLPIPFDMPSATAPFVMMQGELNGRPAHVVLDTGNGAPFTVLISRAEAKTADVTPGDAPSTAETAVGAGAVSVQGATLKSFRLGGVELTDTDAGIADALDRVSQAVGRPVDAVVGWKFLRTRTIRIDYPARRVDLAATAGGNRGVINFAIAPKRPLIIVQAEINGHGPFAFAVDTGAGVTMISSDAARRAGVVSGADGVKVEGVGGGAEATTRGAPSILTLGGQAREPVRPLVVDFLSRISQAAGAPLDGVLGADVLSRGRLTIDFPRAMLWLDDH